MFQADKFTQRPNEFTSKFETELAVETADVCATRCYQVVCLKLTFINLLLSRMAVQVLCLWPSNGCVNWALVIDTLAVMARWSVISFLKIRPTKFGFIVLAVSKINRVAKWSQWSAVQLLRR